MSVKATVIIVNFNSGARLERALGCLARQTLQDFDVIVFDNGSKDGSERTAPPPSLRIQTIANAENIGFAAANNRAAALAAGEWLAFLNPDAYAEPGWLGELVAAAARYPRVRAFGSTQIDASEPTRLDGAGDAYHVFGVPYRGHFGWPLARLPDEGECFAPCAAAAFWSRETFLSLGGFDESFFCYGEDVDLGFRHRLAGGRSIQVPRAVVRHEGSGITGRRSDFTVFHGHRNRIWTFVKNMPSPLFEAALPFHLLINAYLLIRLSLIGSGRAYVRALIAAARGMRPVLAARRRVQAGRAASVGDTARALTWSPIKLARRSADIRPVASSPPGPAQISAGDRVES